jgi:hypothetical protein
MFVISHHLDLGSSHLFYNKYSSKLTFCLKLNFSNLKSRGIGGYFLGLNSEFTGIFHNERSETKHKNV